MTTYASPAQLSRELASNTEGLAGRESLLQQKLEASHEAIDDFTGRQAPGFLKDAAASARTYRTAGRVVRDELGETLLVDEIADVTGLTVETSSDGVTWTTYTGTVLTTPENAIAQARPVTGLLLPSGTWSTAWVRVTAIWGWPAIPARVVQACLLQAARLYKRKDSPEGVLGSAEWGPVRVARLDPDVQALLARLTLPGFA